MHFTARLGLALLALSASLFADEASDIAKFGVTIPTTGLVPALVETKSLAENDHDFDTEGSLVEVDLRPYFTVAGLRETDGDFVQFKTSLGTFNAELLASDTPLSVANFKSYLATDAMSSGAKAKTYDQTFIHRSQDISQNNTPHVVIQGGGFRVNPSLSALPAKAPVVNEFKFANTRGTLAMAKLGGQPNSATNQWFVNIHDNKDVLGSDNNGGFTVFGRLLGNGIQVAEAISKLPTYNLGNAFTNLPLRTVKSGQTTLYLANLVAVPSVRIVPLQPPPTGKGASILNYTVSSDNPTAVKASIANGVLSVKPGKNGGRAILTVRASEAAGAFVESSFAVNRDGPPIIVKQLPSTITAALGTSINLTADITAWPLNIQWQFRPTKNDVWTDIPADDARFTGATTEYLTIKLSGDTPAAVGRALALDQHQLRFRLTNNHGGTPRVAEGNPVTLRVTATLGFRTDPSSTVSSGKVVNAKLGAALTAPLGGVVTLRRPALPATYPAPTYRWERLAPGSTTWQPLANTAANAATPYTGVTTANLTIRLDGPETPAANSTAISTLAAVALHQSQYRCVITHDRDEAPGSQSSASPATTLRITAVPLAVATQPAKLVYGLLTYAPGLPEDQISVTRISVAAKPTANNTPAKYQWQARLAGTDEWVSLVNHVPPTAANGDTPASPGTPSPYKGVDTAALVIRFPAERNLEAGYGRSLDGAQYRCVMTNVLKDASAPFAATAGPVASAVSMLRVLSGTVSLVTPENFRLPGLPDPAPGVRFTVKGLPKGLSMNPETGFVTGVPLDKPGVFKVVVTITGGPSVLSMTYYTELLPLIGFSSGSYEALLSPADQPPLAKLGLTIAGNGALTGKLATAEEKDLLPIKGAVVRDVNTGVVSLKAPVVISRPGTPKGRAYVLTDLLIPPSGTVSVKLHTRETAASPLVEIAAATSILEDDANPSTDTMIEVGDPGLRLSTYTKANPAPWANITRYTLAFTDPAPLAPAESAIPPGSGYATAAMGPDGKLSLAGKLGDGTKFTAALSSDLAGDYRLFFRPYDRPGAYFSAFINTTGVASLYVENFPWPHYQSFLRHAVVYSLGNTAPADDFDNGAQVFWHRPAPASPPPANAKPVAYSAGFPPLGLRVRMEPWYYVSFDQMGFDIAEDGNSATLGLVLSGAGMDNAAPNARGLPVGLRLTRDKGKLTLKDATLPDGSNFSGTIDNATGLFKGELTLADTVGDPSTSVTRKVPFEGVMLVPPEPFLEKDDDSGEIQSVPAGKITAEGLGLVPALPGGAPATSRVTMEKSAAP